MCVLYTYFYGKCYSSSSIWRPASFTFFSASFSCSLDKLMPVYLHPVRLTTSIAKLPQQHANTQSQQFRASLQFLPKFIGKALFSSQTNARLGWHIFREKFYFIFIFYYSIRWSRGSILSCNPANYYIGIWSVKEL